jgi:hypothetical protein
MSTSYWEIFFVLYNLYLIELSIFKLILSKIYVLIKKSPYIEGDYTKKIIVERR